MMVSEIFKKMLSGPWMESQPVNSQHLSLQEMHEGSYVDSPSDKTSPDDDRPSNRPFSHNPCIREVSAIGWDAYALLTVFRIIHGQSSEVPRNVSWELFAQVAVIANYYRYVEALSFAAELWLRRSDRLEALVDSQPLYESWGNPYPRLLHYGRELIMLLFIAWAFSQAPLFSEVTYSVVRGGHGLCYVETYDLPISEILGQYLQRLLLAYCELPLTMILATLETKRQKAIRTITSALSDMNGKVKRNELGFDFHLNNKASKAMVIGILELSLEEHPELTVKDGNYDGLSLEDAIHTVEHEFGLNEPREVVEWDKKMDFVTPTTLMRPIIRDVEKEIGDISIFSFQR